MKCSNCKNENNLDFCPDCEINNLLKKCNKLDKIAKEDNFPIAKLKTIKERKND